MATAFSRVLGLVREQVQAWYFGAGWATDAFIAAFRVPNLLRDLFAEGALSSAFVPIFKERLVNATDREAFALANVVMTAILMVVGLIVVLGVAVAPAIIYISAHGFVDNPEQFALAVDLTRMMMVYLLLVSLSALVMGMLNSMGRFGIPAISSALFNVGTVVTVVPLYHYFHQPVYTLGLGVVVGGVGQLAIQLPSLRRTGFRFRFVIDLFDEGLKRVMRLLTPMVIGLSAGRINILVSTLLASFLMEGSISFLNYSFRLMHFPLGVFAVALGTVTLPRVSEMIARGDTSGLRQAFDEALGLNMFVVMPSAAVLALMGRPLIDVIYQWGAFSESAAANTALALLHYSYGLVGFAAVRVLVPFFYGAGDSRLPMRISVISVVVNMVLYYPLVKILDFAGLAAATSLAGLLNAALLLMYLPRYNVPVRFGAVGLHMLRTGAASLLAVFIATLLPWRILDTGSLLVTRIGKLLVPLLAASLFYVVLCFVFRVPEVRWVMRVLLRRTRRK